MRRRPVLAAFIISVGLIVAAWIVAQSKHSVLSHPLTSVRVDYMDRQMGLDLSSSSKYEITYHDSFALVRPVDGQGTTFVIPYDNVRQILINR